VVNVSCTLVSTCSRAHSFLYRHLKIKYYFMTLSPIRFFCFFSVCPMENFKTAEKPWRLVVFRAFCVDSLGILAIKLKIETSYLLSRKVMTEKNTLYFNINTFIVLLKILKLKTHVIFIYKILINFTYCFKLILLI